jgi:hypothetical protein
MKVVLPIVNSKNPIAIVVTVEPNYNDWERYALPTWIHFCKPGRPGIVRLLQRFPTLRILRKRPNGYHYFLCCKAI